MPNVQCPIPRSRLRAGTDKYRRVETGLHFLAFNRAWGTADGELP